MLCFVHKRWVYMAAYETSMRYHRTKVLQRKCLGEYRRVLSEIGRHDNTSLFREYALAIVGFGLVFRRLEPPLN